MFQFLIFCFDSVRVVHRNPLEWLNKWTPHAKHSEFISAPCLCCLFVFVFVGYTPLTIYLCYSYSKVQGIYSSKQIESESINEICLSEPLISGHPCYNYYISHLICCSCYCKHICTCGSVYYTVTICRLKIHGEGIESYFPCQNEFQLSAFVV